MIGLVSILSFSVSAYAEPSTVTQPEVSAPVVTKSLPMSNAALATPHFEDKISYSIGVDLAKHFLAQQLDIQVNDLMQGVQDGLHGKSQLSDAEIQQILSNVQQAVLQKKADEWTIMAKKNKALGDTFLKQNEKKAGVMKRSSGLQYRVITPGNGPIPTATDKVKTHYRGTLIDGTEFDSSYARNMPAVFPVNGVISGWSEALQLMPVGSKWELVIPPELAYGEYGAGSKIGPNATLIFEVELLSIER